MGDDTAGPLYVALIGDIRGSRELEDRAQVQERFRTLAEDLQDVADPDSIASPFTVTTGDEFQALLTEASGAVQAAVEASDRFELADLRFGLGRGSLDTELNEEQAIGMDGPCFHRAREALKEAREEEAWIRVAGWDGGLDDHANRMLDLIQCVREDWTGRQAEYARALEEEGTQQQVAERFEVSKSTVSESLSAGHVHEVRDAERSIASILQARFPREASP